MSRRPVEREVCARLAVAYEKAPDGYTLGKLISEALNADAMAGVIGLAGMSDEGLLSAIERHVGGSSR